MNTKGRRLVALLLSATLVVDLIPSRALATATDPNYLAREASALVASDLGDDQGQNTLVLRDDCFMRSSFSGCEHLMALSAKATVESYSTSQRVEAYLEELGFQDVEVNNYYSSMALEDSMAVAVGRREISAFGKTYTLLAVIPRCTGYRQEWSSNLIVGTGDMSEGFKAARDEALRFVKHYVQDHGISGDLKIWTAGFSRGAAIANLLGGFFADGGAAYLDNNAQVTPEDVYCYTFGTPRTIIDGLSKDVELSVAGARADHKDDTPGSDYSYTQGGTVDAQDKAFSGIINVCPDVDLIAMLPLEGWGYTHYGNTLDFGKDIHEEGGEVSKEAMLSYLQDIAPDAYENYISNGDDSDFSWKTFDLTTLQIVDDASVSDSGYADFLSQRIDAAHSLIPDTENYVDEGYQDGARSIAALFGLLFPHFSLGTINLGDFIKPVACTYLAYASERLQDEGRASSEDEATTLALVDLLQTVTGTSSEVNTVEDLIALICNYFADNEDSPLAKQAIGGLAGMVPESSASMLKMLISQFNPNPSDDSLETMLAAFLKACAKGADENSSAYSNEQLRDPVNVRKQLYIIMGFALPVLVPSVDPYSIVGRNLDGNVPLSNVCSILLPMLKTDSTTDPNAPVVYATLAEAADATLPKAIETLLAPTIEDARQTESAEYNAAIQEHVNNLTAHMSQMRRLLCYLLFYTKDEGYSANTSLHNAATFIGNAFRVATIHSDVLYLAWSLALQDDGCPACNHYIEHVDAKPASCSEQGNVEYWALHDLGGVRYFADKNLSKELSANELVIEKTDHEWGDWVVTKEATETEPGERMRVCKHDPSHVQTEVIPAKGSKEQGDPAEKTNKNETTNKTNKTETTNKTNGKPSSTSTVQTKRASLAALLPKTSDPAGPWMQVLVMAIISLLAGVYYRKRDW